MSTSERNIIMGLIVAVILVGLTALFVLQYQANSAATEAAYAAATQRQFERNLDRAMTPDG